MIAEKRKRRISKCEVCPYFAKDYLEEEDNQAQTKGKWVCTRKSKVETKRCDSYGRSYTYTKKETACVFDGRQKYDSAEELQKDEETRNTIIERWIRANE